MLRMCDVDNVDEICEISLDAVDDPENWRAGPCTAAVPERLLDRISPFLHKAPVDVPKRKQDMPGILETPVGYRKQDMPGILETPVGYPADHSGESDELRFKSNATAAKWRAKRPSYRQRAKAKKGLARQELQGKELTVDVHAQEQAADARDRIICICLFCGVSAVLPLLIMVFYQLLSPSSV